jgi:hypothetical protein
MGARAGCEVCAGRWRKHLAPRAILTPGNDSRAELLLVVTVGLCPEAPQPPAWPPSKPRRVSRGFCFFPEGKSDSYSAFGFRAALRALKHDPLQSRAELDDRSLVGLLLHGDFAAGADDLERRLMLERHKSGLTFRWALPLQLGFVQ